MDIILKDVEHRYQPNTPFEKLALYDLNLDIPSGQFVAVIGHTGSGKSTIIQHLNALLKPTSGTITIGDRVIHAKRKEKDLKTIRKKVGIVFQFPEHQLFEETVEKDICFGPMNFGVTEEEAKKRAKQAMELVRLPEEVLQRSPFDLSGGQMRRAAIAGILAMEPEVLVLDEPTAGLDPRGRDEIMAMVADLQQSKRLTIVLVTHSMEDAARFADQIVVMHKGTIAMKGTPKEVFGSYEELSEYGLDVPHALKFMRDIEEKLGVQFSEPAVTFEEAVLQLQNLLSKGEER
jgi:energy-coupling factor transport system ATP-binding protein